MTHPFAQVHPDCREFVRTVEELLARRRQSSLRGQTPSKPEQWPREWSRAELTDLINSSYLKMLQGKVIKPPVRSTVLEICSYLECTLEERNRLLVAAHYAPEQVYLENEALEASLSLAKSIITYLPIPGCVITRDWRVHLWNEHLLTLFDVPAGDFAAIPSDKRHMLYLTFDPALPFYHRLDGGAASWEETAWTNVFKFKSSNLLCRNEEWYQACVENCMRLPRFAEFWHKVQVDVPRPANSTHQSLYPEHAVKLVTRGKAVRMLIIHFSFGNFDYPITVTYVPYDEESRSICTEIGVPTRENRWRSADGSMG